MTRCSLLIKYKYKNFPSLSTHYHNVNCIENVVILLYVYTDVYNVNWFYINSIYSLELQTPILILYYCKHLLIED